MAPLIHRQLALHLWLLLAVPLSAQNGPMDNDQFERWIQPLREKFHQHNGRTITYAYANTKNIARNCQVTVYQHPGSYTSALTITSYDHLDRSSETYTFALDQKQLSFIDHENHQWVESQDFIHYLSARHAFITEALKIITLQDPPQKTDLASCIHPVYMCYLDPTRKAIFVNLGISNKKLTSWEHPLQGGKQIGYILTRGHTITILLKDGGHMRIDSRTALLDQQLTPHLGGTVTLTRTHTTGPPATSPLPDKTQYTHMLIEDYMGDEIDTIFMNISAQQLQQLSKNKTATRLLTTQRPALTTQLANTYYHLYQQGKGISGLELINKPKIAQYITAQLDEHTLFRSPEFTRATINSLQTDSSFLDQQTAILYNTHLANIQQDEQIWETDILAQSLQASPEHGELTYLVRLTIRDALFHAQLKHHIQTSIDRWILQQEINLLRQKTTTP